MTSNLFPVLNTWNWHEKYWRCHPLGYDAVQSFEIYGITFHKDVLVTAVSKALQCICSVYLLSWITHISSPSLFLLSTFHKCILKPILSILNSVLVIGFIDCVVTAEIYRSHSICITVAS